VKSAFFNRSMLMLYISAVFVDVYLSVRLSLSNDCVRHCMCMTSWVVLYTSPWRRTPCVVHLKWHGVLG